MPEIDNATLARQLWAIGDEVRLELLLLLPISADCEHGNNVSQLAEKLGLTQPTVSHHLRILRQAGLVNNRRMCRDVFYWIDEAAWRGIVGKLCKVLEMSREPAVAAREA